MDKESLLAGWQKEAEEPFQGWDFSYLDDRYHEEQPPWSYDTLVREILPGAETLLDMGTGGGEKLLEFADALPARTIATEGYPPNVPVARAALEPHGIQVMAYDSEHDDRMPFADNTFDVILNRHESFDAREIARVLRPGGIFFTQQVDGRDMADLYELFGVETAYAHVNLADIQAAVEQAGLVVRQALDWQGKAHFTDVGALVYYLHAVPWEAPADFSVQRYGDVLLALHARPWLEFTIGRFYLRAHKPG